AVEINEPFPVLSGPATAEAVEQTVEGRDPVTTLLTARRGAHDATPPWGVACGRMTAPGPARRPGAGARPGRRVPGRTRRTGRLCAPKGQPFAKGSGAGPGREARVHPRYCARAGRPRRPRRPFPTARA